MRIRRARPADLVELHDVWLDADGADELRSGDRVLPLHRHELDTGTVLVAVDDTGIVGFGAIVERDGVALLADLFVRRHRQSRGIGRRLLGALFASHPDGARATMASSDRRAQALYEAFGMQARFTNHYLASTAARPVATTAEVESCAIDGSFAALDADLYGRDRRIDLEYWASLGAVGLRVANRGDVIGVALVCTHTPWNPYGDATRIGPTVARDAAVADAVVAAALDYALGLTDRAGEVRLTVPDGHPALAVLLEHGFAVVDADVYMSSRGGIVDPRRMTLTPDLL